MNRPQGDCVVRRGAMRPLVPRCPRQMHRSLIPGTTSFPTSMKSAGGSPVGCNADFFRAVFFFATSELRSKAARSKYRTC